MAGRQRIPTGGLELSHSGGRVRRGGATGFESPLSGRAARDLRPGEDEGTDSCRTAEVGCVESARTHRSHATGRSLDTAFAHADDLADLFAATGFLRCDELYSILEYSQIGNTHECARGSTRFQSG